MLADGKGGAIVNLASIASILGLADRFAYSATKGAVLTMTYSVATDYVARGIRCNAVCPGRAHAIRRRLPQEALSRQGGGDVQEALRVPADRAYGWAD